MLIAIQNFGPFESAQLELKPLTIIIGKNSVGKSMLLYLLWALTSAEPKTTEEARWDFVFKEAEDLLRRMEQGSVSREDVRSFATVVLNNAFKRMAEAGLEESLRLAFRAEVKELITAGAGTASIEVKGRCGRLSASIQGRLSIDSMDLCLDQKLQRVAVEKDLVRYQRWSVLTNESRDIVKEVETATSLAMAFITILSEAAFEEFQMLSFASSQLACLLPDSRAGVARTLLKPYFPASLASGILGADREYISWYFRLTEKLGKTPGLIKDASFIFKELGVTPEVRLEGGAYVIYLKTWTGKTLPLALAPSGVREVLSVVLALLMPLPRFVFMEEPEAHLHPRAQRLVARLFARAANIGKHVVLTTHGDYVISEVNNLIALSAAPQETRARLGYGEEALKPDMVAVYLVKAEGGRAVVERLKVDETGIPEDEFAKVAEEILKIRNELY